MNPPLVHIQELRLRAPGLTREQARHLGEALARRLANLQPAANRRNIAGLAVNVRPPASASIDTMADAIADGIRRRLK
jgi:hypothetical protein